MIVMVQMIKVIYFISFDEASEVCIVYSLKDGSVSGLLMMILSKAMRAADVHMMASMAA